MRSQLTSSIPLVAALALSACGQTGDDPNNSPPLELAGIWNADQHWQTLDGQPYEFKGAVTFRFDRAGSGWACSRGSLQASSCAFDGDDATSFVYEDLSRRVYSSYTREITTTYTGEAFNEAGGLQTHFTAVYSYLYTNGSQDSLTLAGETTLYKVERFDAQPSSGLRLLGEFGDFSTAGLAKHVAHDQGGLTETGEKEQAEGASANVRVKGDYAYVVRFSDGLYVLDISDPADIREVGHASVESVGAYYYNDVKLFSTQGRDYAVVSDAGIGLVVYDVTDPTDPTFVSSFFEGLKLSGGGQLDYLNNHTVYMVGTTAYMGNYDGSVLLDPSGDGESGGLLIVDLSDPANPRELGRWLASDAGGHFVHDLMIEGDVAYLASWEAGLVALDISEPSAPQLIGQFTYNRMTSHSVWVAEVAGRKVAAHGDEDFGSHLRVVDADPDSATFMQELGALELRPHVSIHNVMIHGDEVIAAHYQDGLRIFDISDPSQPKLAAWYNSWLGYPDSRYGYSFYEGAIGVDVQGDRIYLADIERGLLVFERE